MWIGRGRKARRCYGFDEVSLVPGRVTIDPEEVETGWELAGMQFSVPIVAAAMDGVVDVRMAIEMSRLGGLAVLNLEGVATRYQKPEEIIEKIVTSSPEEATRIVQSLYEEPIKEELVSQRIREIKDGKGCAVVSSIPQRAERFGQLAAEAGADIFVVQATVTTVNHRSRRYPALDFAKLCREVPIPVVVGNCVDYEVALELMEAGIDGLLVGVGPGAACTTRGVLGLGVPQVTATADTAAARDFYYKQKGRYVPIITDGGMTTSGDICKAFGCGADAVMVGSALARAEEAPGKGYHWGMATTDVNLPRGTRIRVGTMGSLKEILFGPARLDDGTQNLVGALKVCMGCLGASSIRQMQLADIVIAPAVGTEGKVFQAAQRVGITK